MESRGAVHWLKLRSGCSGVPCHCEKQLSVKFLGTEHSPKGRTTFANWPPVHYLIAQVEQDVNTSVAQFDRISFWKPQLVRRALYSIAKLYFVSVTNEKRGHIYHFLSMGWPGNSHLLRAFGCVSIYKHKGDFVSLSQSVSSGLWGKRCICPIIPFLFHRCFKKSPKV